MIARWNEIDADTADGRCQTAAGSCTLRAAVMQASTIIGTEVDIILPSGIYMFTRPSRSGLDPEGGDLDFLSPDGGNPIIHIFGSLDAPTIIDANGLHRVIQVHPNRHVILTSLTLRHGFLDPQVGDSGAGVRNEGVLELVRTTIFENVAYIGAGIANEGTLLLDSSTISGNVAFYTGGGIMNEPACFSPEPTVHVVNSTITDNLADHGAAIFNCAALFITNSTLSKNRADSDGGAIYNFGDANVYNSTIVFNQADADMDEEGMAGGILNHPERGGQFNLRNTLVAGNYNAYPNTYDECAGELTSFGRNLIGVEGAAVYCDIHIFFGLWQHLSSLGTLGSLSDNGGPTYTHALLPGSNAIDAGDPQFGCVDQHSQPLQFDQRFQPRVVDGDNNGGARCDIGAFEYSLLPTPTTTPSPTATSSPTSTATPSVTPTATKVPGDEFHVYLAVLL